MNFVPEQRESVSDIPYFEDVKSSDGWQGQTTGKSIETLKSEIVMAVSRLGGSVASFQRGKFSVNDRSRCGYRLTYTIETANKEAIPGRIDIAALPVKKQPYKTYDARCDKSIKMALYMLRDSFDGLWFLQQLSPGFSPLMPFMLCGGNNDLTISQMWSESGIMKNLLPPPSDEFVDGDWNDTTLPDTE